MQSWADHAYLGDGLAGLVGARNQRGRAFLPFPDQPARRFRPFKLGICHSRRWPRPDGPYETHEALKELDPCSRSIEQHDANGRAARHREAKERIGRSEYLVGLTYYA